MDGINESTFYQHRWHFGVLEYIEAIRVPNSSALGQAGADLLMEYFRKDLPLVASAVVPDFKATRLGVSRAVKIWVGVEMHGNKHIALLHVRDAHPLRQGNENVVFSSEHRGGIVIIEDQLKLTYNTECQLFLCERRA